MLAFLAYTGMANARKSKLAGSWLMTTAKVDGKIEKSYFIKEFKEDGKFQMIGIDFGIREYNPGNNSITLKSKMDKAWNVQRNRVSLTGKKLVLNKDGAKLFYL